MAIPEGKAGIIKTLKIMRALVREYKTNLTIRLLAQKITQKLPPKNYTREAIELHKLVRDKIRYVKDVNGVETIQTPIQTLRIGSGDCDDQALLVAALLESIGHKTQFIACGFRGEGYSHVFVRTKIGPKWVSVECTEPWPLGKEPPNITSIIRVKN